MSFSLGKDQRIRRFSEYQGIYKTGVKLVGRYLVLFYCFAGERPTRVGLTVSSKVGNAVERNRAKRRIREALRVTLSESDPKAEIVLVAMRRINKADFGDICQDLRSLLVRLK